MSIKHNTTHIFVTSIHTLHYLLYSIYILYPKKGLQQNTTHKKEVSRTNLYFQYILHPYKVIKHTAETYSL